MGWCTSPYASTETAGEQTADTFTYEHLEITIEPGVDLRRLVRRINLRRIPGMHQNREPGLESPDPRMQFGAKTLVLFRRVQTLLNMWPKDTQPVKLHVFATDAGYQRVAGRFGRRDHKAFYHIRRKTIYFRAHMVNEYILAHELAHALIDQYFIVSPPETVQEILAVYCDTYLKDPNVG